MNCQGSAPPHAAWFGFAVAVGIAANCVLAVPGMIGPARLPARASRDLEHPIWPAAASMLSILLSVFYIPGAIDPYRYTATVDDRAGRPVRPGPRLPTRTANEFPLIGYIDLFFLIIEKHPPSILALRQR